MFGCRPWMGEKSQSSSAHPKKEKVKEISTKKESLTEKVVTNMATKNTATTNTATTNTVTRSLTTTATATTKIPRRHTTGKVREPIVNLIKWFLPQNFQNFKSLTNMLRKKASKGPRLKLLCKRKSPRLRQRQPKKSRRMPIENLSGSPEQEQVKIQLLLLFEPLFFSFSPQELFFSLIILFVIYVRTLAILRRRSQGPRKNREKRGNNRSQTSRSQNSRSQTPKS